MCEATPPTRRRNCCARRCARSLLATSAHGSRSNIASTTCDHCVCARDERARTQRTRRTHQRRRVGTKAQHGRQRRLARRRRRLRVDLFVKRRRSARGSERRAKLERAEQPLAPADGERHNCAIKTHVSAQNARSSSLTRRRTGVGQLCDKTVSDDARAQRRRP